MQVAKRKKGASKSKRGRRAKPSSFGELPWFFVAPEPPPLPGVIDEIADIISALGSQVLAEKQEYETFLKSLTTRLSELDEQIHIGTDEDNKAFQERHHLGRAVEQEVKGIISHVEVADNLDQLKLTVNQRLDFLNQHFDSYRQSDQSQFEQSKKQIQALI